ncbi:MAG: ferredoxin [Pseudonocardiaceae bacterium]
MSTHRPRSRVLRVDPIACRAHGLCAELLPEAIGLDEWGYPLLTARPVDEDLLPHAHAAVAACPTLALRLVPARPC